MKPTAERVRELLHYDPETGIFTHRIGRKLGTRRATASLIAGRVMTAGYCTIGIDCRGYYAHRLAWLYMTGQWPPVMLDHINGKRDDNRFVNLRLADPCQNSANSRRHHDNKSGLKGVHRHVKTGKWLAQISYNRVNIYLGLFATASEAHAAYVAKARELFGDFARAA